MKLIPLLLFVLFFCIGCNRNNKTSISKIEIATGYCHGECPFTATKIDSSLKIEFYGGEYADKKGYYKGSTTQQEWNNFTGLLDSIKFQNLANRYQKTVDDQELEIIITTNGKVKHIIAQSGSLPKPVRLVFYSIANSYKKAKIKSVRDSIQFNTKIQFMLNRKDNYPNFPPSRVKLKK